ncbi:MAG: hypothetical protein Q4B28_07570 [bacterium]|nr:hypothetical protein [bacterium]
MANPTQSIGAVDIDYNLIKHEVLYLSELQKLDLTSITGVPALHTFGLALEKSLIEIIRQQFVESLPADLKKELLDLIGTNPKTLSVLLSDLHFFGENCNAPKDKKTYTQMMQNFKIPLHQLCQHLQHQ